MTPVVIAHRTCAGHAPENSLEGIARAAQLGADAVEIDVRLTRDGLPVLMHDRTLRRSTGNHAPVWALSQNEIRRLRLPNDERVPTLGLALAELPDGLRLAIHVKVARAIHPVLEEVRNQDAAARVWIWSEHGSVVRFTADRHPEIDTTLLRPAWTRQAGRALLAAARRTGARGVGTYWRSVTEDLADTVHGAGLQFTSWCRTPDVDVDKVARLDGIVSDWPDRVRATIAATRGEGESP